jgi:predicted nuclease with TOPRIM domain
MQEPPGKATHMSSELVQRALKICSLEDQLSAAQAQSSTDKAEFLKLQAENANLKNQIDERINKFNQLEGSKDLLIRKLEGSKDQLIGQLEDAKLKLSQDSKTKEVCSVAATLRLLHSTLLAHAAVQFPVLPCVMSTRYIYTVSIRKPDIRLSNG